jgi:Ca2+-binding RTX toxin-like protein
MPIISLTDNDDVVTYEGSTTIAPLMEAVPFSPSIPFVYDGYDETGTVYTYVADTSQVVSALKGNDTINAGQQNDQVYGGLGTDTLYGGQTVVGQNTVNMSRHFFRTEYQEQYEEVYDPETDSYRYEIVYVPVEITTGYLYYNAISSTLALGGDDVLSGGSGDDYLYGDDGHDQLLGAAGNDVLEGGQSSATSLQTTVSYSIEDINDPNNNNAEYTANTQTHIALGGNDTLSGNIGNDQLNGGDGDDTLYGDEDHDYLYGGSSTQLANQTGHQTSSTSAYSSTTEQTSTVVATLIGGGADQLYGGTGNDFIYAGDGNDQGYGGDGNDYLDGGTVTTWTSGTTTNTSTSSYDYTNGYNSSTYTTNLIEFGLIVSGGNDVLYGGAGDDSVHGQDGDDQLYGEAGVDHLYGGYGVVVQTTQHAVDNYSDDFASSNYTDTISLSTYVSGGNDQLYGGSENDFLDGGDGDDQLHGGTGDDAIYGGYLGVVQLSYSEYHYAQDGFTGGYSETSQSWFEQIYISGGHDLIYGDEGADTLDGQDGNDVIYGGTENDMLYGGEAIDYILYGMTAEGVSTETPLVVSGGNDQLYGDAGADGLFGGDGNDRLDGGADADEMVGGTGNDTYVVDHVDDVVMEQNGQGLDTVEASINYTLGTALENLRLTGIAILQGTGNGLNNVLTANGVGSRLNGVGGNDRLQGSIGHDELYGGSGNDEVYGGFGNDLLDGGDGTNILQGGAGDDRYVINSAADAVTEQSNQGLDIVQTRIDYVLGAHLEHLQLLGTSALNGAGNELDNTITGNGAANNLTGKDGNDILFGGGGVDTLRGGFGQDYLDGGADADIMFGSFGDDTYIRNHLSDVITEFDGQGIDTVETTLSYTLTDFVENLTLKGIGNLTGTGNGLANIITGTSGNNVLSGLDGADTLYGAAGADRVDGGLGIDQMIGGIGDDVYVQDHLNDVITELANEGIDTVESSVNSILTANVEHLILTGTALKGVGNDLANTLTANHAGNQLSGLAGNDLLIGGNGSDRLDGGTGVDEMRGGLGDDVYVRDSSSDVIVELADQGVDTVESSLSMILGDHLENLTLTGTAATNALGNSVANVLRGNTAANLMDGKAGNDTLIGGRGNDTYSMKRGYGQDLVIDSDSTAGNLDRVLFGGLIDADQLWLTQTGNDLLVSIIGTADSIRIKGWYQADASQVEQLVLADGRTLTDNNVQNLVNAMAGLTPPPLGQTELSASQHSQLDAVIAANWV